MIGIAVLEWPLMNQAFLVSFFATLALTLAIIPFGQRRPVAPRVALVAFGGMGPDLDPLPASGAPSPARRTVPDIQKPPPPIRSTMGAPGR